MYAYCVMFLLYTGCRHVLIIIAWGTLGTRSSQSHYEMSLYDTIPRQNSNYYLMVKKGSEDEINVAIC